MFFIILDILLISTGSILIGSSLSVLRDMNKTQNIILKDDLKSPNRSLENGFHSCLKGIIAGVILLTIPSFYNYESHPSEGLRLAQSIPMTVAFGGTLSASLEIFFWGNLTYLKLGARMSAISDVLVSNFAEYTRFQDLRRVAQRLSVIGAALGLTAVVLTIFYLEDLGDSLTLVGAMSLWLIAVISGFVAGSIIVKSAARSFPPPRALQ